MSEARPRTDLGASPGVFRVSLLVLGIVQLVDGAYALLAPRSFFDDFPAGRGWVEALPAYNEHLTRDVGALFLATAVFLLAAAWFLDRRIVATALAAFLTFSLPHLIYHALNLDPFTIGDAIAQTVALLITVVLPAVLLVALLAARKRPPGGTSGRDQ